MSEQNRPSNADLLRQSRSYRLVESDSDDDRPPTVVVQKRRTDSRDRRDERRTDSRDRQEEKRREDKVHGSDRRRYTRHSREESEEKVVIVRRERRNAAADVEWKTGDRKKEVVDNDQHTEEKRRQDSEMDKDIAERDAFVKRLHNRDDRKTSRKGSDDTNASTSDSSLVIAKERLDELRELSRQKYLESREQKELELLERQLAKEATLFAGEKLSAEEQRRINLGKKILEMGKDKRRFAYDDDDGYRIPTASYVDESSGRVDRSARDEALLRARYTDRSTQKENAGSAGTEQEAWEAAQQSRLNFGRQTRADGEAYELVFEDQVEFVSTEILRASLKHQLKARRRAAGEDVSDSDDEMVTKDSQAMGEVLTKSSLKGHEAILEGRKKLPVYAYREEFLQAVQDNKVLIVVGETGSGKTTQLPQYLHESGWSKLGKIGCTQPRRVAAMSVAARVATEMNVKLGAEVGYSIRFEDCTSESTIIKYMTDGMLLREFMAAPDLGGYSVMMIDEAHERTLQTDVLFGLVKDISRFRGDDFRLVIASATLDAERFSAYFDGASIFMIPGRMFPVDVFYTKAPEADYLDAAVVTVLQIHVTQAVPGDILVFLTGQEEIEAAAEALTQRTRGLGSRIKELMICPIYANLPSEQQAKIFEPTPKGGRKVVLATNIAETSLTIDGICYVVDAGFSKQKSFNPRSGMESLIVSPISQAAANQRSGRAGRTQPGKCFRLYTAWSFQNELEPNTVPEIQRTNMCSVVLLLKSLGINDLLNFDFMDKPSSESLIRALEQLYALGALNDRGELTKLGRRMSELPIDPMMAKALLASEKYGCSDQVLSIVSMLSIGSAVFHRPKDKAVHADTARMNFARGGGGDHCTLMRVFEDWRETGYSTQWCYENYLQARSLQKARDIREQLEGLCERVEIAITSSKDLEVIGKAMTSGYFYHTAKFSKGGEYRTVKGQQTVYIHPSSVLAKDEEPPKFLLYFELTFTTKEYMRTVMPIKGEWLLEIAPHFYNSTDVQDSLVPKKRHAK